MPVGPGLLTLDVCTRCHCVWFDPGEFQAMPQRPVEMTGRAKTTPAVAEAVGRFELEQMRRKREHRDREEPLNGPDDLWKWLAGFAGLPVNMGGESHRVHPWATWAISALVLALGLLAFRRADEFIRQFGFVPADAMRLGGATLITSFFVHADLAHLLGNVYFLWFVGTQVEQAAGALSLLLLLLLAASAGCLAHAAGTSRPDLPLVGASAGISGAMAYFALRFPSLRIGVLFYWFLWLRIPAWAWFGFWLLFQLVGLTAGNTGVSYLGHIGGAAVGLVFWFSSRRADRKAA